MWTWILFVACGVAQPSPENATKPGEFRADSSDTARVPTGAIPASQLTAWIADLDSNQYRVREKATQQLQRAGMSAFDALLSAANGDRPEAAERALWIMQHAATSVQENDDDAGQQQRVIRRAALERLAQVVGHPHISGAAALELARLDHDLAVREIARLGGQYLPRGVDKALGLTLDTRVELDEQWRGGDEGLKHLLNVNDAGLVRIIRAPVTSAGIAQLRAMTALRELQLYKMDLTDEEVANLTQSLPGVKVDFRRGALLGVTGSEFGPAVVTAVQPRTAAAAAGIVAGDAIQKVNDQEVATFRELTDTVSKYRAGDEVTLTISRGGKVFTQPVKFGSW